ncbi:MAG TPA: hypothetical protein VFO39_01615 [Candidatus Sulfotelmatobacter sp.]|nr:hypothetical protein [Candidatus Sulfotelmatobacter sp.]
MGKIILTFSMLFLSLPLCAQAPRLWVLRGSEMAEYDPATFAAKATVKVPAEASRSPQNFQVNRLGQMLFETPASVPLSEEDAKAPHKVWFWDGHTASTLDQAVSRRNATQGSNLIITEWAPTAYLAADGTHLFWFANEARRLQREGVDLSTTTTWQAWQTDLAGGNKVDIASHKFSDCRCSTGSCEESCPYGEVWIPPTGLGTFFLVTSLVTGQTGTSYESSSRYVPAQPTWSPNPLDQPLERVLDANADGTAILNAIPDSGCCGWANESDDQLLLVSEEKKTTLFDERASYNNPDYDVSFYTANAALSPDGTHVAMTVAATSSAEKPIQLADEGQANPDESSRIRKGLTELPGVEVKKLGESASRVAFVPHANFVGWVSDKEILLVQERVLVGYNVTTGVKRKSTIRVPDAEHVFVR